MSTRPLVTTSVTPPNDWWPQAQLGETKSWGDANPGFPVTWHPLPSLQNIYQKTWVEFLAMIYSTILEHKRQLTLNKSKIHTFLLGLPETFSGPGCIHVGLFLCHGFFTGIPCLEDHPTLVSSWLVSSPHFFFSRSWHLEGERCPSLGDLRSPWWLTTYHMGWFSKWGVFRFRPTPFGFVCSMLGKSSNHILPNLALLLIYFGTIPKKQPPKNKNNLKQKNRWK